MEVKDLRDKGLIIFEAISGSRAYGLDTPQSDTDIKGVFILPKKLYYSLGYIPQVSNKTNDVVFYEFRRFMELLSVNNPTALELLNTPEDFIIHKHPVLNKIDGNQVLSRLCKDTFGGYAISQIKKAKGLKKKITNPVPKERKSVLDFCYVSYGQGSIPLPGFLKMEGFEQGNCGLVNIPHMSDIYGMYHDKNGGYKGIVQKKVSNDISLSTVPKGEEQVALLYFNRNGYSAYCREYKEYWDWVDKRNEARYQNTQGHGKNYDAKNMMHTFRLLEMALEIGKEGKIKVRRTDREFLLKVRSGCFGYDELLEMVQEKQVEVGEVFETSRLPDRPNIAHINQVAYEVRDALYQ